MSDQHAPTNEEREALVRVIDAEAATYDPVTAADSHDLHEGLTLAEGSDMAERIADAILAAGFRRHEPGPVTEARCEDHHPVQHRDGKPPWCKKCGLTAQGTEPTSRFAARSVTADQENGSLS